jgi:hypothetical protein
MKLLMVGFDGLDPSMVTRLPTFGQFEEKLCLLRSVPSTMTQEAWAAMYTGRPPSEINVVALPRDPDRVSTLKGIGARTIFEAMGDAGLRIGCIGMPMTFPVKPIDAFIVAGFPIVAPRYRSDEEYFYPPTIKDIIEANYCAYLWANEEEPPSKDEVTYEAIEHSIQAERNKLQCTKKIMAKLGCPDVDFLAIGFSFTDIAAHCRRIYPIERTYYAADKVLREILETFEFENLLIVSDHGLAMMPWRGEPFPGYSGIGHRLYGTCICVGKDIEAALKEVKSRRGSGSWISCYARTLRRAWQLRKYGGLFKLYNFIDITDVYSLITRIFGLPLTSKLVKQESEYSDEELRSIEKHLELLGYM